jgi:hypothetical protein
LSCVHKQSTGGVRPNASENSQISHSTTVLIPELSVAVRSSRRSCSKAEKRRIFMADRQSSGVKPARRSSVRFAPATSIRRTVGGTCCNRSWPAIGASSSATTSASAPMPLSQPPKSTSSWRQSVSSTRSGCPPIRFSKRGSGICLSAQLVALRTRSDDITPASVSGAKLDQTAPSDSQSRLARGLALSARWFHRHQHNETGGAGRRLLQSARHGGAVDQGRQECPQVDPPVMLLVHSQCRAASASCAGLQSHKLHADAGSAGGSRTMVADEPAGEAHQNRRHDRAPWPLRHLPDGQGCGAERIILGDSAADRRATATTGSRVGNGTARCVIAMGEVYLNDKNSAKSADQTSLGTTETLGALHSLPVSSGSPAVCYRLRCSTVHLGNVS